MANLPDRLPENVPGEFYVDRSCIDCDACVEACPVDAIYSDFELPERFAYAEGLNEEFFAERSTIERTAA